MKHLKYAILCLLLSASSAFALTESEGRALLYCHSHGDGNAYADGVHYQKGFEDCAKLTPVLEQKAAQEQLKAIDDIDAKGKKALQEQINKVK